MRSSRIPAPTVRRGHMGTWAHGSTGAGVGPVARRDLVGRAGRPLRIAPHPCVLTVYGSAARGEGAARDLDIGVITEGADLDVVTLTADLMDLTGTDRVDLAHLNRAGPVLKERALRGIHRAL